MMLTITFHYRLLFVAFIAALHHASISCDFLRDFFGHSNASFFSMPSLI